MVRARPAVIDGLTYWSLGDVAAAPERRRRAHLLPVYDEYLVAFRDRQAVPHGWAGVAAPSAFQYAVVVDGQLAGMWRIGRATARGRIDIVPLRAPSTPERRALADAVARYARFLGTLAAFLPAFVV